MGRKPQFSVDDLLDAALHIAATDGPAATTALAVGQKVGAPSGSIYHRFANRDEMMARLWLRCVASFQEGFLTAAAIDDVDEALTATISHVFDWTRTHHDEAVLLLMFDTRAVADTWPTTLAQELRQLNGRVRKALQLHAQRRFDTDAAWAVDRVSFAMVDLPYAAVRRHLPHRGHPQPWLRAFTLRAAHQLLNSNIGA